MSIFDKLKSTAQQAATSAIQSIGNKREKFTFASLPESLAEAAKVALASDFVAGVLPERLVSAYAARAGIRR